MRHQEHFTDRPAQVGAQATDRIDGDIVALQLPDDDLELRILKGDEPGLLGLEVDGRSSLATVVPAQEGGELNSTAAESWATEPFGVV